MPMNITFLMLAAVLSTGVEIPEEGVPVNNGGHQYTTRMEKRPAAIADESAYLLTQCLTTIIIWVMPQPLLMACTMIPACPSM